MISRHKEKRWLAYRTEREQEEDRARAEQRRQEEYEARQPRQPSADEQQRNEIYDRDRERLWSALLWDGVKPVRGSEGVRWAIFGSAFDHADEAYGWALTYARSKRWGIGDLKRELEDAA